MGFCVLSGYQQGQDWEGGLPDSHACSQAILDPELAQVLGLLAVTHVSKTRFTKTTYRPL